MVAAHRAKSADKHEVCRKVTLLLKKAYGATPPKQNLPVLETLLYAICLENSTPDAAAAIYARMLNAFHDLNEVRVSSISELSPIFEGLSDPEWRAARAKSALQYVFETNYAFDFESLRRKTTDLAVKQLSKIPSLSAFVRTYVLQHCLGSHALPVDDGMHAALVWLGLANPAESPEQTGEHLRAWVRKADAPLFCHLLGCLASDPKKAKVFAAGLGKGDAPTENETVYRLENLFKRGDAGPAKAKAAKPAARAPERAANSKPRSSAASTASKKRR